MSTLFNKSYLVKVSTKGDGVQKCPNFVNVVIHLGVEKYVLICSKNQFEFCLFFYETFEMAQYLEIF